MTWKSYNTAVRIPPLRDNTIDQTKTVYIGAGDDNGYTLYYSSALSKWVISEHYGMVFLQGSSEYVPTYININGYCSYYYESTGNTLWYDLTYGWMISSNPGISPVEYWMPADPINNPSGAGAYTGTAFYTGTPPALGSSATFEARGNLRGTTKDAYSGTAITLTTKYERWESSTLYGEYIAAGGASGTKYCGLPQWTDGDSNTYIRSLTKTADKYTYGAIRYDTINLKWLIGTYGSVSGWYEGSEPSKTSSVVFTFTVPEASELSGTNKTIGFDEYVKGENVEAVYLTEAGTWRDYQ